jgi:hypothetical protein
VSSYQVKISESCFVWAAPIGLRGVPSEKIALNSLRGAFAVEESNPARVVARTTERILFSFIKKCPNSLSVEASLLPVLISTALN